MEKIRKFEELPKEVQKKMEGCFFSISAPNNPDSLHNFEDLMLGLKILKKKYGKFPRGKRLPKELKEVWDRIGEIEFAEVAKVQNVEARRIAFSYMGTDQIFNCKGVKLEKAEVIKRKTSWINWEGVVEEFEYDDKYELYSVPTSELFPERNSGVSLKFLKMKDTSTNREYIIWVPTSTKCPIEGVAWTITVPFAKGDIEFIIRQGDCILVYPKAGAEPLKRMRHLTKEEYLELIKIQS